MRIQLSILALFVTALLSQLAAAENVYTPPGYLMGSPVLLQHYVTWDKYYTEFTTPGTLKGAYMGAVDIVYDSEIGRPWGNQLYPEAQSRLTSLRKELCPGLSAPLPRICSLPTSITNQSDITSLAQSLADPTLNRMLAKRWKMPVKLVHLPNAAARDLNVEVGPMEAFTMQTNQFWNMKPQSTSSMTIIPIVTDTDSYLASFGPAEFPAQFALSNKHILLNDWLIRDRAMTFAGSWKFNVDMALSDKSVDPIIDTEELLYSQLFAKYQNLFQSCYRVLFAEVQGHPDIVARFKKERANGDYPDEVYQHVAYHLFLPIVRMESAYYDMAQTQRQHTTSGMKSLESMLTLQRYVGPWKLFLLEVETLSAPFTTHAAILDQNSNFNLATIYASEQIHAILQLGIYAKTDYFKRFGYTLLTDALFNSQYLKSRKPAIYKQLYPNGKYIGIQTLSQQEQLHVLREYQAGPNGKFDLPGLERLAASFFVRVHEKDARALAKIVHNAHQNDFH